MATETDEINDTYWRSQLWAAMWPLVLLLWVPWLIAYSLDLPDLVIFLSAVPLIVGVVGALAAHFGFIFDGRAIRKSEEHAWKPWWIAYFAASMFVGVFFIAPIYVLRRRQKTGEPTLADVKRKLSIKGLLIPWY